jgi:hypothetical protein
MRYEKHLQLIGGMFLAALVTARANLDQKTYDGVIESKLAVGDIVFTRIGGPISTRVAVTTRSWTSHVGIIVDYQHGDWVVAESGVPCVRKTPLRKFLGHSADQEFAIVRLRTEPTDQEKRAMLKFADSQVGKFNSLGCDLQSRKTFCSKFVHDVVLRAPINRSEKSRPSISFSIATPMLPWRSGERGSSDSFRGRERPLRPPMSWLART